MSIMSHDEGPENFGDAPRLRNTASGRVSRFGVENLADIADARLPQFLLQPPQHTPRPFLVRIDLQPGIYEVSDQPPPRRPLMICRVPGAEVTKITRLVIPMTRIQGSQ